MAIMLDGTKRIIVQGISGKAGAYHTLEMLRQGTNIVAGISPGKGGQSVHGVPLFDSVREAVADHQVYISLILVPAASVRDSVLEAIDGGVPLIVVIAEGVPVHDTLQFVAQARKKGLRVIGPNSPGIFSPGKAKLGIMPTGSFSPGNIGIVSRSGTLSYEISSHLTRNGLGQSSFVGIGGDLVSGTEFVDVLKMFNEDSETKAVVLIGEIGGAREEEAADFIRQKMTKPVVAYITGRLAQPGKRMGHAGALVIRGIGTYESKLKAMREAGVPVAQTPADIPQLVRNALSNSNYVGKSRGVGR
jgi:succinyl-CoA synthetase alpha subunit